MGGDCEGSVGLQSERDLFYKSQESAPNACQQVSKVHWKKLAKSSLQFLFASFYFPGCYCRYVYSVISVIADSQPGNTKTRESTRSWTARVRSLHPWAVYVFKITKYTYITHINPCVWYANHTHGLAYS